MFHTTEGKMSKVRGFWFFCEAINHSSIAVTLDGTVIHKSGLITGGRSSHNSGKTWEEKEVQSKNRMLVAGYN